ncbi:MAG: hypothetical protein OXF88_08950 [Rhodobacteraceae bacterium]|nr:hypothetical protein [Paracoccaceae bacterium]MCY4139819.1 hypothetical protein [Paracoccaceae bacterium]
MGWAANSEVRDAYFGVGAGPLAAVEGLHREFDQDLVGGMRTALGRAFDPFPLRRGDSDVLVQGAVGRFHHRVVVPSDGIAGAAGTG